MERYTYSAYGVPAEREIGASGNPLRYTARPWDAEIGLNNYRARVYSPSLGRFMQLDPIGYGDGLNMYAYVGNDPVNLTDPSGQCPWCVGALVGAGLDYGLQVASNRLQGKSWKESATQVSFSSIAVSAGLGAAGQFAGSRQAVKVAKGLSNKTKGNIEEGVARAGIAMRGERVIAAWESAGRVANLSNRVTGRAAKSVPDFVVTTRSGTTKIVEAKFNTSRLTGAQRALRKQMGDDFMTSRTTLQDVGRFGATVGGGTGALAGSALK